MPKGGVPCRENQNVHAHIQDVLNLQNQGSVRSMTSKRRHVMRNTTGIPTLRNGMAVPGSVYVTDSSNPTLSVRNVSDKVE